jgi:hypothetical protein
VRIEWHTVCKGVAEDADGFPNIYGALVDTSYVQRLGEEIAVGVALVLAETYVNINRERVGYTLNCKVEAPDGQIIASGDEAITGYIDTSTYPAGHDGRVLVTAVLRFTPETEGLYQLTFAVDEGEPRPLAHYVEIDRSDGGERDAPSEISR